MRKLLVVLGLMFVSAAGLLAQTGGQPLKVGDTAPDFTLTDTTGQKVTLSEFRGKSNVVLAFYVFAFTGG
jgi:peroxiredoxin